MGACSGQVRLGLIQNRTEPYHLSETNDSDSRYSPYTMNAKIQTAPSIEKKIESLLLVGYIYSIGGMPWIGDSEGRKLKLLKGYG
jgi:hypothetical protein